MISIPAISSIQPKPVVAVCALGLGGAAGGALTPRVAVAASISFLHLPALVCPRSSPIPVPDPTRRPVPDPTLRRWRHAKSGLRQLLSGVGGASLPPWEEIALGRIRGYLPR